MSPRQYWSEAATNFGRSAKKSGKADRGTATVDHYMDHRADGYTPSPFHKEEADQSGCMRNFSQNFKL